ncbi:hypothetical protein Hoch_3386 [Haliangium ochraceum DSM 14365]|uniref:Uncharacterized protein n=2 Tax=Haliangium ochraceum TaxID=80816 RepID=D0LV47_HALO1|nr:hypothetical protein Hoch_3386 [Haliangium ochraceum DSM 14365]
MPFAEGFQWTYIAVSPPEETLKAAMKIAANKPKQPDKFVVKVTSVQPAAEAGVTDITLEETSYVTPMGSEEVIELSRTTKLSCVKDALDVSLDSFFFSGEPGGPMHYEVSEGERPEGEHSYKFQLGTLRVPEWIVNVTGTFQRNPSEGTDVRLEDGTLDLQRIMKRGGAEEVGVAYGTFSATPVQVELVGSVTLNMQPEAEKFSIPANTFTKLWVADDIGIIQVANSNGHNYQLSEFIKSPADAAAPAQGAAAPATPAK